MPETQEFIFAVGDLDMNTAAVAHGTVSYSLKPVYLSVVEMEDVLFHLDSAVMMPENPSGKGSQQGTTDDPPGSASAEAHEKQLAVGGLQALALVYKQFELDPDKRLVIAGHTDTSGKPGYNFELSEARALNVLYLLTVDRENWAQNSAKRHRVEDIQQILRYCDGRWDFDCDPGKIDDTWGNDTETASESFLRTAMSEPPESEQVDALLRTIHATHKWPIEVWRRVFDLYSESLAGYLQVKPEELGGLSASLIRWLDDDKKFVACGESFPIDDSQKSNYRSQTNRRVELLLFDKSDAPVLDCPGKVDGKYPNKVHESEECPLWDKLNFIPSYIDPRDLNANIFHLRFAYYDPVKQKLLDVPAGLNIRAVPAGGVEVPTKTVFNDGVYHVKVQFRAPVQDEFVMYVTFQFRTADQWIYTAGKDATPAIVTLSKADYDNLPRAERTNYYKLPEFWSSSDTLARYRQSGEAVTNDEIMEGKDPRGSATGMFGKNELYPPPHFKPFGPDVTTHQKPVVFCLDDIVLASSEGDAMLFQEDQGVLFDKDLHIIDPDAENHQNYLSKGKIGPNVIPFSRRMIGVRAILHLGELYALNGDRTRFGKNGQGRAGLRAACLCGPPRGSIARDFGPEQPVQTVGKANLCFLGDWDTINDEDISFLFVIIRWKFSGVGDPQKPNDRPFNPTPEWQEEAAGSIVSFWNRRTKAGVDEYVALTAKDSTGRKKRTFVRFYLQPVKSAEHTPIKVLPASAEGRSFMGRTGGELRADQIKEDRDHWFVGAHEFGHAAGLPDEYLESAKNASYRQPGFVGYTPGSPYSMDDNGMMIGNQEHRARYYWHLAEWLRANDGLVRTVEAGKYTFRIEPHPKNDKNGNYTYTSFALKERTDVQHGSDRSKYDLLLNVIGSDEYGKGDSPNALVPAYAVDGLALILLKLRLIFVSVSDYMDIQNMLIAIRRRMNTKFNFRDLEHRGKWFVRGTHAEAPAVSFQRCALFIHPRFVVRNFPKRDDSWAERYAKDLEIHRTNAAGEFDYHYAQDQYHDKVDGLERGRHFGVTIKSTGWFEKNYARWDSPTGRELLIGANSAGDVAEFVTNAVPEMLGIRKKPEDIVPKDLTMLVDNYINEPSIDTFK